MRLYSPSVWPVLEGIALIIDGVVRVITLGAAHSDAHSVVFGWRVSRIREVDGADGVNAGEIVEGAPEDEPEQPYTPWQ